MTEACLQDSSTIVRPYQDGDYDALVAMYDQFKPKGMFQGMPPRKRYCRIEWIDALLLQGENFLAWNQDKVIGHVVILPDKEKNDAEYLIFVSQQSRGKGVGKALTKAVLQRAKELGISMVWLTVDAYNFRGIKLYKRFNFKFKEANCSVSERTMVLNMAQCPNGDRSD